MAISAGLYGKENWVLTEKSTELEVVNFKTKKKIKKR
jgi:hypothetical protein